MDGIEKFRRRMAHEGIVTDEQIIPDGGLHRFHVNGDKAGIKDGFYALHSINDVYVGMFGWWRHNSGEHITWCSEHKEDISLEEGRVFSDQVKKSKLLHEVERKKRHSEAREIAKRIWNESKLATDDHPYLVKKRVKAFGVRVSADDKLIIPLFGIDKQLHTLQFISSEGEKRFLSGGMISGNYFPIGKMRKPTDKLYIGEGYATCMTIYQATGCAVACAFNCGNLLPVARAIRTKLLEAEIIVVADNDIYTDNNPGLTKAREIATSIGVKYVYPDFAGIDVNSKPTDFNDLMQLTSIADVKRQLEKKSRTDDEEWPEPELIQNELHPVELLPASIIPKPFYDYAIDVTERMQCPLDFFVIALLNVVSSVIGAGCGIKPKKEDNWLVIPNLWGGIVARPGKLKTPPVVEAMRFLDVLEADARTAINEELKKYNLEMEAYKAKRKAIISQLEAAEKNILKSDEKDEKPKLTPAQLMSLLNNLIEPKKPVRKRLKTNDVTIEKLLELLAENPRGILVFRDELMGLLRAWERIGHEGDRSFYLEGWNGNASHTTDRISRGTNDAENVCISVFGTIQPDRLISYLYAAIHGDNDGLMQRFQLLVYPDATKWKLVDKKPNKDARDRVFNIIKQLVAMDFIQRGAAIDEGEKFPYFRFDAKAQEEFYDWLTDLEGNKLSSDDHSAILEHLSKYKKLMPALALLFYLIDLADGGQIKNISIDHVQMAAAWCEYLESHARRVYGLIVDIETQAAAVLSKKIQSNKLKNGFTVRDVYRQKGVLKKKDIAQAACDELVDARWLRKSVKPTAKGQKEVITYLINPKINLMAVING
jgi:putative DNA primase/helicase